MNDKYRIFNTLDKIEDRVGLMAHEIDAIRYSLLLWQDGKIKDFVFQDLLNKYLDSLNSSYIFAEFASVGRA